MDKPERFELVIVDNGSSDDTALVIKAFEKNAGFNVVSAFESVSGLGNARNRGWRMASGEICAFTDDDCYVERDFAHAILAAFRNKQRLGYLGGRIMLFDPTDLRITINESKIPRFLPAGRFVPAGVIQGANFSFRRRALDDARGFDPLLGAGTRFPAEDVEICARLSSLGWDGMYSPSPVVHHHHGRKSPEQAGTLHESYDVGRGAYYCANLLNPGLRLATTRFWFRTFRTNSRGRNVRELQGAFGYLGARLVAAMRNARR